MLIFFLQTQVFSALMTFQFQVLKTFYQILYTKTLYLSHIQNISFYICVLKMYLYKMFES